MKKILMVIAVAAICLTVIPQVQAQDMAKVQQLSDEANRIEAQARGRAFTVQEMQRLQQIQQEIMQAMGMAGQSVPAPQSAIPQQQPQQRQTTQGGIQRITYPGATAGWPATSAFKRYGKTVTQPNIQTAQGITVSYKTEGEKLIVYISKNTDTRTLSATTMQDFGRFTDAELLALLNHFERAFGAPLSKNYSNTGYFFIEDPTKVNTAPTQTSGAVDHYTIGIHFDLMDNDTVDIPATVDSYPVQVPVHFVQFAIEPEKGRRRWGD
jgi:hypothetical protein